MDKLRITINYIFAVLCICAGLYLLGQESYYLPGRYNGQLGHYFSGLSLYLLAAALFFFAAFTMAVAYAWIKGDLSLPNRHELRPHSDYKGQILIRYWYWVLPAFVLLLAAFMLSQEMAHPALR